MTVSGCTDEALRRPSDVAIVGAGPVGLKLALDLADAGVDVLLIESGRDGEDVAAQRLSDATIVGALNHAPMDLSVRRGLGGTAKLWGGRAVAFDDLDFEARTAVPDGRWPIAAAEVRPWYGAACAFLDCGPAVFDEAWPGLPEAIDGLRLTALERWCAQPDLGRVHGARVAAHKNIRLALRTTALRIWIDPEGGAVRGLYVNRADQRFVVTARSYVIAAGGVETARLLLAGRAERPALFGGPEGALGRYYMGHAFGSIADIHFLDAAADRQFDFHKDTSGRYVRRRFALDAATQGELGLMNMAAWPDLPELHDPAHGSAILSLAYLALATPTLGPRLMAPAIRKQKLGPDRPRVRAHAWNVVKGAPEAASFASRFLGARYAGRVRLPGFFVRNREHRYALHFHAEQAPNAESRVTLSSERDGLQMLRARIDLKYGGADARSIVATHEAMATRLLAAGIARIEHRFAPEEREAAVLSLASDGFHQIGTARMSAEPKDGVVDGDARVHGIANLFLAGSAIFPSSGQANPTLLAVALAARLADHIKRNLPKQPD